MLVKLILQLEQKPSKEFMIELNKDWEKWSSYASILHLESAVFEEY